MNCHIFTQFAQSIGPSGGDGCALPAGISKSKMF